MSNASPAKGVEIVQRLARHLADERDLQLSHAGTRYRLESEAGDLIDQWRRCPKPNPTNDAEVICAEAIEHERQLAAARSARNEQRHAFIEEQHPQPEDDPDHVRIVLKCASTLKVWEIAVPKEQARLVIDNRTVDGRDRHLIRGR